MSKQLKDLPLRGIVAYAVRCAMRVRPLYSGEHAEAVDRAIRVALDFCLTEADADARADARADADADAFAAYVAARAAAGAVGAAAAATAATNAADAARRAADADAAGAATKAAGAASDATFAAATAVSDAYLFTDADVDTTAAAGAVSRAYAADLLALGQLGLGEPGELGSTIDPSEDGPLGKLWPDGEPKWLKGFATVPQKPSVSVPETVQRRRLSIVVDESVDKLALADFLAELSALYGELSGGDELVIREGLIPVNAEVTV